jgi:hypothetical protein
MERHQLTQRLVDSGASLFICRSGHYIAISNLRWKPHTERFIAHMGNGDRLSIIELQIGDSVFCKTPREFKPEPVEMLPRRKVNVPPGWSVIGAN